MPSPRIAEPGLVADGRSVVRDQTFADTFAALAPIGVDALQGVIVKEYEQVSFGELESQINSDLERTRALAAGSSQQMDQVQAAGQQAVSQYAMDISRIENAVSQGALGANAAKTRINNVTRDYARRFPAFASEFTSRNSGMEGMVDQAYQNSAEFQLAERKAKEIQQARDRMISLAINPDDPVAVDQYMRLEAAARQNAVVKEMLANRAVLAAAEEETLLNSVEDDTIARGASVIGSTLHRFQAQLQNAGDANAPQTFAAFRIALEQERQSLLTRVALETKNSAAAQRIKDDINSMFNSALNAADFTAVSRIYEAQRNAIEARVKTATYGTMSTRDAARVLFGTEIGDVFQETTNLTLNEVALRGTIGDAAYEAAVASQQRIATLFYGSGRRLTQRDITDANQRAALQAVDPKAPVTPVTALAGRELILNLRADSNIPETAIATAYEKSVGLEPGERVTLAQLAARPRVLQAVQNSPVFQAQVRREIVALNQTLSRFDNVRMYVENKSRPDNWTLKSGNQLLMMADPFYVYDEAGAREIEMPVPYEVRTTIRALIRMQDQGVDLGPAVEKMFERWNPRLNPIQPAAPANQ